MVWRELILVFVPGWQADPGRSTGPEVKQSAGKWTVLAISLESFLY
jgi:hypothetical protein